MLCDASPLFPVFPICHFEDKQILKVSSSSMLASVLQKQSGAQRKDKTLQLSSFVFTSTSSLILPPACGAEL